MIRVFFRVKVVGQYRAAERLNRIELAQDRSTVECYEYRSILPGRMPYRGTEGTYVFFCSGRMLRVAFYGVLVLAGYPESVRFLTATRPSTGVGTMTS